MGDSLRFVFGRTTRGQGATEYLVLLAVVLIVALVAITLLISQIDTVSEAKFAQNQLLWKSQAPVSISASAGYKYPYAEQSLLVPHIEITNTGIDSIRLSTVYSGNESISYYTQTNSGSVIALSDVVISPGDRMCFGNFEQCIGIVTLGFANPDNVCYPAATCLRALTSNCKTGGSGFATASIGFTYDVLVYGNSISKRQGENEIIFQCGGCCYYSGMATGVVSCGTG